MPTDPAMTPTNRGARYAFHVPRKPVGSGENPRAGRPLIMNPPTTESSPGFFVDSRELLTSSISVTSPGTLPPYSPASRTATFAMGMRGDASYANTECTTSSIRDTKLSKKGSWTGSQKPYLTLPQDNKVDLLPTIGTPPRAVRWRPWWLRQHVFLAFAFLFLGIATTVAALYWYSETHNGIVGAKENGYYWWTFGPTAALTVVAAFWFRVELQALKYAPWIYMAKGGNPQDMILLDYCTMFSPKACLRSWLAGHYLVALTLGISFLLRLQVVLSTGLLALDVLPFGTQVPVSILDSFEIPMISLSTSSQEMIALINEEPFYQHIVRDRYNVSYPFGLVPGIAYETFEPAEYEKDANHRAGGEPSVLRQVVVGMGAEFECEHATSSRILDTNEFNHTFIQFEFDGREPLILDTNKLLNSRMARVRNETVEGGSQITGWFTTNCLSNWFGSGYRSRPCKPDEAKSFQNSPVIIGAVSFVDGFQLPVTEASIFSRGAMLCKTHMWASNVEVVVENGIPSRDVTVLEDGSRQEIPFAMQIMAQFSTSFLLMETLYSTHSMAEWFSADQDWKVEPLALVAAAYSKFDNVWDAKDALGDALYHWDADWLEGILVDYWAQLVPFMCHYSFRQPSLSGAVGIEERLTDRLVLGRKPVIAFISFCIANVVMAFMLALWFTPREGLFRNLDPGAPFGLATIIKKLQLPRRRADEDVVENDGGPFKTETLRSLYHSLPLEVRDRLSKTEKPPKMLSDTVLVASIFVLVGLGVSLLATLSLSQSNDGIATVPDDAGDSINLLWTAVPVVILFTIPLYTIACNSIIRRLSPLSKMSKRPCGPSKLDDKLDMIGIRAIWNGMSSRLWTIALWEVAAILASLATILGSMLFTTKINPTTTNIILSPTVVLQSAVNQTQGAELITESNERGSTLGILLVSSEGSIQYPAHTYENLVFPKWEIQGLSQKLPQNPTIHAKLPAFRLRSQCTPASPSEYLFEWLDLEESLIRGYLGQTGRIAFLPHEDVRVDWDSNYTAASVLEVTRIGPNPSRCGDPSDLFSTQEIRVLDFETTAKSTQQVSPSNQTEQQFATWLHPEKPDLGCYELGVINERVRYHNNTELAQRWLWGSWNKANKNFTNLAIHECTYSWEDVDVDIILQGQALDIDYSQPPRPDESSARPANIKLPIPEILAASGRHAFPDINIRDFPAGSTSMGFAEEFRSFHEPMGNVTMKDYENPDSNAMILEKLNKNIAILSSQVVSAVYRVDSSSVVDENDPAKARVPGILIDGSRQRIIQSPTPTYILSAIIWFIAAVNMWSFISMVCRRRGLLKASRWLLDSDFSGLVPNKYGSIAASIRLWDKSNIYKFLPQGPERGSNCDNDGNNGGGGVDRMASPEKQIMNHFKTLGYKFRLGWWRYRDSGEEVYAIMVVQDNNVEYLGTKQEMDLAHRLSREGGGCRK